MFKNLLTIVLVITSSLQNNAQVNFNLQMHQVPQENHQHIPHQTIMAPPKVITKQIMKKPKIITERVNAPARVVTDHIVEPTRQRIVIQPRINKTVETLKPQYNVQPDQTQYAEPVTQATKYQYESRNQVENVPGDIINNNYIVQPSVKNIRQNVQFVPQQEVRKTLNPIHRQPTIINNTKTLDYVIPADKHISQTYVQPIQQKEHVNVHWTQEKDNVINLDPITRQPIYQQRNRVQNVNVPGNVYYRQNIVQPTVNREEVEVRFNQPSPNHSTNLPIIKPTQHSHQKKVIRKLKPYVVKDEIPVGVPTPVVHDVPVYQYQYVPVEEPCDPCCCDKDPMGGIESIINSSEVVITNGDGKVISGKGDRYRNKGGRGDRGDRGSRRGKKDMEFEDAVKHFKGLYGDDTFKGDLRFFDFERDNRDPNITQLKREVLTEKANIIAEEDEKQRLAYLRHVYGSRCKRYRRAFGDDPFDPIFKQEKGLGKIPALNGYKNYEYYEDC